MRRTKPVNIPTAPVGRRRYLANALFVAAALVGAALVLNPPTRAHFYPICPIHQYLGILCPGCGATRALAALIHGRLAEALRLNALFVMLLPALLAGAIESYRRALRPESFRWPEPPVPALHVTLAATAIFTVARNFF